MHEFLKWVFLEQKRNMSSLKWGGLLRT
jgi:hypothetical protein